MEIKPNELRIGNLLHREDGTGVLIDALAIVEASQRQVANGNTGLKGIELTPEWLTRLGWVWNPECNSWEKYPNGDARMHLKFHDVNASYTMFNYVLRATIAERIYYVHQLMNLYFALTGEELAIDKTSLKN